MNYIMFRLAILAALFKAAIRSSIFFKKIEWSFYYIFYRKSVLMDITGVWLFNILLLFGVTQKMRTSEIRETMGVWG